MGVMILFVLAACGVTGSPSVTFKPETASTDISTAPNSVPEMTKKTEQGQLLEVEIPEEDVMETGELNPNHYPAQRAAKVVQHFLNTRYGSPFRLFGLQKVHSGSAEDVADSGRKYHLELTVHEIISNAAQNCSAEVLFPRGEKQQSAHVQASCEELLKINITSQEEALYEQFKTNQSLVSAEYLPDSHGHILPQNKPLWHLGIVASSFVMLKESSENSLYNMAQVANITLRARENGQLKFDCHTLLHEMVSQEIVHWKLQFTWSPAEGVRVLQMEQLPHCHECEEPPNN